MYRSMYELLAALWREGPWPPEITASAAWDRGPASLTASASGRMTQPVASSFNLSSSCLRRCYYCGVTMAVTETLVVAGGRGASVGIVVVPGPAPQAF